MWELTFNSHFMILLHVCWYTIQRPSGPLMASSSYNTVLFIIIATAATAPRAFRSICNVLAVRMAAWPSGNWDIFTQLVTKLCHYYLYYAINNVLAVRVAAWPIGHINLYLAFIPLLFITLYTLCCRAILWIYYWYYILYTVLPCLSYNKILP